MATEDPVSAASGGVDAFNAADRERCKAILTKDSVYDEVGTSRRLTGHDEIIPVWQGWREQMPDVKGQRKKLERVLLCGVASVFMVAASGCAGCVGSGGGESTTDDEVTTTGTSVEGPLSALRALSNLANDAESLQAEIVNMEPVDPVHFSVLLEALPDAPDEWTSGEPRGQTNQMGGFSMSMASNDFRRDDGTEMEVTISDFAFNQLAYSGFAMGAAFSQETTEGYNRGITVGEDPGREEFDYDSREGSREVLYRKRYHIKVSGRQVTPEDLETWYARVKKDVLPLDQGKS